MLLYPVHFFTHISMDIERIEALRSELHPQLGYHEVLDALTQLHQELEKEPVAEPTA